MTDLTTTDLTPAQIGRREASKPQRVTGRLKRALDMMAWEGLTDNEAAVRTGMTVTAIRLALRRPHVRTYYRGAIEVLRERERAQNIHALIEVRNQRDNQMARVAAVKAMQATEEQEQSAARTLPPGLVIVVNTAGPVTNEPYVANKAKPLIVHEVVSEPATVLPNQGDTDP